MYTPGMPNPIRPALADVIVEAGQEIVSAWQRRTTDDPYAIVGVFPGDPPEMVEAVYRAKAKYLHPDNKASPAADAERFRRLKDAYDKIKAGTVGLNSFTTLGQRVQEALERHQQGGA